MLHTMPKWLIAMRNMHGNLMPYTVDMNASSAGMVRNDANVVSTVPLAGKSESWPQKQARWVFEGQAINRVYSFIGSGYFTTGSLVAYGFVDAKANAETEGACIMTNTDKLSKTFMKTCEDRMAAIFTSWPAQVPIKAQVNEFIPEICGLPYDYLFCDDPVAMAECTLLVQEYLGLDVIHSNTDMYNFMPSALGAKITRHEKHAPEIDRNDYLIKGPEDLDKIKYHGLESAEKLQYHIAYNKAWKEYVGTDFPPTFDSPWNLAANLYGLENLVVDTISDPEFVHELMRRIVCDFMAPFCDEMAYACEGIPYIVGADAWASLPIVSYDVIMEYDKKYVELLNKEMKSGVFFASGGYWGLRYLKGEQLQNMLDYTIAVGGGILYGYDPDPDIIGPETYRKWADEKNAPLLLSVMNVALENDNLAEAINYVKRFVLAGKDGKTSFQLNFSNIGPELKPEFVKTVIDAARFYGRVDTGAESVFEVPSEVESFKSFLERKLENNHEGYRFEWLERSSYRDLAK